MDSAKELLSKQLFIKKKTRSYIKNDITPCTYNILQNMYTRLELLFSSYMYGFIFSVRTFSSSNVPSTVIPSVTVVLVPSPSTFTERL